MPGASPQQATPWMSWASEGFFFNCSWHLNAQPMAGWFREEENYIDSKTLQNVCVNITHLKFTHASACMLGHTHTQSFENVLFRSTASRTTDNMTTGHMYMVICIQKLMWIPACFIQNFQILNNRIKRRRRGWRSSEQPKSTINGCWFLKPWTMWKISTCTTSKNVTKQPEICGALG